jgi:hypothetical protein
VSDNEYDAIFAKCKTVRELETRSDEEYEKARNLCGNDYELRERVDRDITNAYSKRREELEQNRLNRDRNGFRRLLAICRTTNELNVVFGELRTKIIEASYGDEWTVDTMLREFEEAVKEREKQLRSNPTV